MNKKTKQKKQKNNNKKTKKQKQNNYSIVCSNMCVIVFLSLIHSSLTT